MVLQDEGDEVVRVEGDDRADDEADDPRRPPQRRERERQAQQRRGHDRRRQVVPAVQPRTCMRHMYKSQCLSPPKLQIEHDPNSKDFHL